MSNRESSESEAYEGFDPLVEQALDLIIESAPLLTETQRAGLRRLLTGGAR